MALTALVRPARASDDDPPDVTYRKAVELQQKIESKLKKAGELEAQAAKSVDAADKERLQREAKELRQLADELMSDVRSAMEGLAPKDRKGYGPAHLWLFEDIYRLRPGADGKQEPPPPLEILQAERHLLRALEWPEESVRTKAHFNLARLYRDTNRIEDAKKHLMEVSATFPEYRLILAQWAKNQNEKAEVIAEHAKVAEDAFRARLKRGADDHEARFGLISCLMLQSKFSESQELINVGATLAQKPDMVRAYARKLVELLMQWVDAKEKDPNSTVAERFQMLEQAVRLDPDNPEIFNRLLKLCRDKSPEAQKVRYQLHRMASDGKESFLAHLFLGIDAWQQDKPTEARHHWEKAFKLSDGAPIVANNLAWLLAFSPPVDLPRALDLINQAIKAAPDEPRFRGTRGHILLKLGRHKEALEDLEKSIKAYPKDVKLFRALSEACTKLDLPIKAEQYKKRADELEAEEKAKVNPVEP
jgi:tetratricopeptide (TPR) repeat protein